MPENSGEFAVNEDLYNHLLEWFDEWHVLNIPKDGKYPLFKQL
jgi:hypothetical protein